MAINLEIKKEIENRTRRLGTRADSYLEEFFDIINEYPHLENMDDFYNESERLQKSSSATFKQFKEVFFMFRLIDIDGNIICPEILTKEFFVQLLTSNLKITLNNRSNFESEYKNNYKLINNFIYIYGIILLQDSKTSISKIYDPSLEKRTSEMKSANIVLDSEMKNIISREFALFMDECGHKVSKKIENKDEGVNIGRVEYDEKQIYEYKEKLQSEPNNILDLIKLVLDDTKEIIIPFYQREYVWTTDLITGLLEEISSKDNEMLNIGSLLISIDNKNPSSKVREYSLVDGQQRLTSLIMIINYLSKELSSIDLNKYNLNAEILLLVDKCKSSEMIKTLRNRSNPKYLVQLKEVLDLKISGEIKIQDKQNLIKTNYKEISSFISQLEKEEYKVNLFNKLAYVFSTVIYDSESDQIELFISTNSSRKPLSNYDLIRSFIISKIPENTQAKELSDINEKMNNLNDLLKFNDNWSEVAEDTFFNFFLNYTDIMIADDSANNRDLFKRFRYVFNHKINTVKDVKLLLEQLISTLQSYRAIKGVDEIEGIYIKDFILSLGQGLKVTSIYDVFMIYAVEKTKIIQDNNLKNKLLNEFRKILLVIEQFEIKWKLFTFSGDSLSNSLTSLFKYFYEKIDDQIIEEEYDDISNEFKKIILERKDDSFVAKIICDTTHNDVDAFLKSDNIEKQKNALKILNRVAFNLFNNGVEYKSNSTHYYYHSKPTIEHIFPRAHSKWSEDDKTNSVKLVPLLEEIGNKFIFNKDENSSAGNKTFKDKLKHYINYNDLKLDKTLFFKSNNEEFNLLLKEKWTPEDIHKRSNYIIKELLNIWEVE